MTDEERIELEEKIQARRDGYLFIGMFLGAFWGSLAWWLLL